MKDILEAYGLVSKLADALDQESFDDFMSLCSEDMVYKISAFSPEIAKETVWLKHDKKGLMDIFKGLPRHIRMEGKFLRQVGMPTIKETKRGSIEMSSPFTVIYTDMDGKSRLFAAGNYLDTIKKADGKLSLSKRTVKLHTRDLSSGCHVPL